MSADELAEIREILAEYEKRLQALESPSVSNAPRTKNLSVKEFILQKDPKGDVQKTLVIGYYLEHDKNVSPFNIKDIEAVFMEAREKLPANLSDKVSKNIRKGLIMDSPQKKDGHGSWALTSKGESFVTNSMPSNQK